MDNIHNGTKVLRLYWKWIFNNFTMLNTIVFNKAQCLNSITVLGGAPGKGKSAPTDLAQNQLLRASR